MKNKLLSSLFVFAALFSTQGIAQTPAIVTPPVANQSAAPVVANPYFIRGNMNIAFDTVLNQDSKGRPLAGSMDTYKLDVNVSNSIRFHGVITRLPYLNKTFGSQQGFLNYDVKCGIFNPRNLDGKHPQFGAMQADIGQLAGTVSNDKKNVYNFATSDLKLTVESRGSANGFDSKFDGVAFGKPPADDGIFSSLKKQAISITHSVQGHAMTIKVAKYDIMSFENHVVSAGPVSRYPSVAFNGKMVFDYDRASWHFVSMTCVYAINGEQHEDRISGNIRWVEDNDRANNGKGEYVYNIMINEPPANDQDVFTAPAASDENAFFATDDGIPSLVGTMSYQDTITPGSITKDNPDGNVTNSDIKIDLVGNKLTAQQTAYLAKLLLFSVTVPLNSN